jgi:hypothetical protein
MIVKFSTLAGGVFIEVKPGAVDYQPADRCFRFDRDGNAEYALLVDLKSNPSPRWWGHAFKADQFVFA